MQSLCRGAPTFISHNPTQTGCYSLYVKALQLCIENEAKRPGRSVHNNIITTGLASDVRLGTKLIIFYVKFGDTRAARDVFDVMSERSVVTWTAMISGYSQYGYNKNALMVFVRMCFAGVKANQFTYASALKACTSMRCLRVGMQIQGLIQKSRLAENLFVQSTLVDFYAKCGKLEDACYLFGSMQKRDLVSWNAMIGGFAVQGFANDSLQMFRSMIKEGMAPDCFTFTSVLKGLAQGDGLMKIKQIHGLIIQLGFGSPNGLSGSLINAYAKSGSLESAFEVYKRMKRKDIISCTSLITRYARSGNHRVDLLYLLKDIIQMHEEIDNFTSCSMLNICANLASLCLGRQIHALALKYQYFHDVAVGNALIDMYAKCGEICNAISAFDEMEEKNVISWTSLIEGYAKHGYGNRAIALYKKMEHEGLRPNEITFLSLLFACSHSGMTHEGWECFGDMINKYNILPRKKHFSCLVDLLARGGELEAAYKLICEIRIPNASMWGAFLGACRVYGSISFGEVAAMQLFCLDPENSVNHVVLAGIYAAEGAWEDSRRTRDLLKERRLRKGSGYSLLQTTEKRIVLLQPS